MTRANVTDFLAGKPKRYMVNPLDYFAARITTAPPIQLSDSVLLMTVKAKLFLEDKDLPTSYIETFLGALHEICLTETLPAALNAYIFLELIEDAHPLVQDTIANWKDEGLFSRLEEIAKKHHESVASLMSTNPQLAASIERKRGFYVPPSMAGGQMPVIIGRQEESRRAKAYQFMEQGTEAEKVGDFSTARDFYEKATQLLPRDRDIAFAYAQVFLRLDEPETSVPLLRKLCETAPRSAKFQSALGSALAAAGRPEEALDALDSALDLEPSRPVAVANKAMVLNKLNREADAAALLLEAFDREPPFVPTPELNQGVSQCMIKCILAAMKSNDLETGDRLAERLSYINPNNVMSWELRAVVAARRNRAADAVVYYTKVLDIDPTRASAVHSCLSLAPSSGITEKVVELARRYLAVGPDDGNLWNDLGYLFGTIDNLPEAIECYRKATLYVPEDALHWSNLGGALIQSRSSMSAISEGLEYLDRAVAMLPDHLPARFNRAAGLLILGRFRDAEEAFAELLQKDSNFPQAADLLAVCREAHANDPKDDEHDK